MSLNLLITVIIVISCVLIYIYSDHLINRQENFENLPLINNQQLSEAIRKDEGLESQIESIANQITKREEHYKSIERQYMKHGDLLMKKSESLENINNQDTTDMIQEKLASNIQDTKVEPINTSTQDLSDYVHKNDVPDMDKYVPKSLLKKYVKKSNVPDINKYILRTAVPSQPHMNKYILRSQVPECPRLPNLSQYIKKTELPQPTNCPDLTKFVLKTSVPPCHKPVCPKPVCPTPNCIKCNSAPVLSEEPVINKPNNKPNNKPINTNNSSASQIVQTINLPKKFFKETNKARKAEVQDKVDKINKDKDKIQKMIDQYKPKVEEKKCTFFRRIVKNADVYGAY